jgi:hypothetical protein
VTELSTNVVITWDAPYDGGSNILSYTIVVMTHDGVTYAEDLVDCDGTDAAIVSGTTCSIPITTLKAAPYSHPWGASIYVKVLATNVVGGGPYSTAGNGAIILTTPFAPQVLVEDPLLTNKNQIGL